MYPHGQRVYFLVWNVIAEGFVTMAGTVREVFRDGYLSIRASEQDYTVPVQLVLVDTVQTNTGGEYEQ